MAKRSLMQKIGKIDRPIEDLESDSFEIGKYITGLSAFIRTCDTPMTVAIQGDWGSGKTSFMNLIRKELEKDAASVWFNTWQFSQFNLGNLLSVNLLGALVEQMRMQTDDIKELKDSLGMVYRLALSVAEGQMKFKFADALDDEERGGLFTTVTQLRSKFEETVKRYLKAQKKERLVLFIDDLDRLTPGRAVEVLEILKLFLDCKNCVFVLAIDYDVVCRGIQEKYGKDMDEEKGRSFFDKIIQVPFKMPVAQYQVETYLKDNGIAKEFAASYKALIETSIGCNPRAIKRILNAFQLIKLIYGEDEHLDENKDEVLLFAVLCLQLSYEEIYNAMVRNEDDLFEVQLFNELKTGEAEGDSLLPEFEQLVKDNGLEPELVMPFMQTFCEVLAQGEDQISEQHCNQLNRILRMAGTAATVVGNAKNYQSNGRKGTGIRYVYDEGTEQKISLKAAKERAVVWENSKFWGYSLFGEERETALRPIRAVKLTTEIYEALYKRAPDRFAAAASSSAAFAAASRKKAEIPGTEYSYDTDNKTVDKMDALYRFMVDMGEDPAELIFHVTLKNRVQSV